MIQLKSLSLTNFMCIDQLDLAFDSKSMLMISGENGSGKSSVFAAVALVWVGYRKGDSYKDFIQLGQSTAKIIHEAEFRGEPISFDFTISNDKYETPLTRKITYKGTTYNNSECDALFKQFDLEYLEHVMFLFQGDSSIVDLKPTDRARLLKKLFHFEFDEQVQDLKSRLAAEQASNTESTIRLEEAQKQTFRLLPLLDASSKGEEAEINSLLQQLASVGDHDEAGLRRLEAEVSEKKSRKTRLLSVIQSSASQMQSLGKRRILITEILPKPAELSMELESELLARTSQMTFAKKQALQHSLEAEEIQKQIASIGRGVCHSCGQVLNASLREPALREELVTVQAKMLRFQDEEREYQRLADSIRLQMKLESDAMKAYSEQQRDLKSQQDRDSLLQATKERLEDSEESLMSLEKEIDAAQEKLTKAREFESQIILKKELLAKKSQLEKSLQERFINIAINQEREKLNKNTQEAETLHNFSVQRLAAAISTSSLNIEVLKRSVAIMETEFPNFTILRTCGHVEAYVNEFIQKVFPYMRVKLSPRRGGVEFYYTTNSQDEEWLSIKMASGAQSAILSLAWRVAIAKLYGITALLLDEIDASSTAENSKLIYEFVASLEDFQQIVLISHRKEALRAVASLADNVSCYVVSQGVYTEIADPESL